MHAVFVVDGVAVSTEKDAVDDSLIAKPGKQQQGYGNCHL